MIPNLRLKKIEIQSEEFDQFYSKWESEIAHFMPDFEPDDLYFSRIHLLLIDENPAGLFIYHEKGEEVHIELDFLSETYRNQGIGKQIFESNIQTFRGQGFKKVIALAYNEAHENYLKLIGFAPSEKFKALFELNLK